jgi:hypothetical protein
VLLTIHYASNLINALGQNLVIKEVTSLALVIQCLLSPAISYRYYNEYWFRMMIPEETYFAYVLPAVLALLVGLNAPFFRNKYNMKQKLVELKDRKSELERQGLGLIVVGYAIYLLSNSMGGLGFIAVALSLVRFVGFFYLWFSESKYTKLAFVVIFIPYFAQVIGGGVFIDMIVITFFLLTLFMMKRRFSKALLVSCMLLLFFFIFLLQAVKRDYRVITWKEKGGQQYANKSNTSILAELMLDKAMNLDGETIQLAFATFNQRLNQGFILASELKALPARRPFVNGEYFVKEFLGVLLPRAFYPDKPEVGDHDKFNYCVTWKLHKLVSMNIGIVGDGYLNFGPFGGVLFCFFFGFFLNYVIYFLINHGKMRPEFILWIPVILFYAMRIAGNDFYIITNWIVKVGAMVFAFFYIMRKTGWSKAIAKSKKRTSPNSGFLTQAPHSKPV